ncbi:MAG TPA: alginate lyase family protein [Terriglobales bacterium]|nr:alginate lyase family protein [Terriglobales bacterium]
MGRDELADRLRQQLTARVDALRYRAGQPVVSAPTLLATGLQPQFFFSPESIPGLCALLRQRLPQVAMSLELRAQKICEHRFDLLGYEGLDYGPEIDWHLDRVHGKRAPRKAWHKIAYLDFNEVGDSKVTWELNRHQHFVTLAKAYRLSGNERFAAEIFHQWQDWHLANPYPVGINWASSLEVAFRSLSWIWTYHLLQGSSALPANFREQWLRSQAVNGRHLETYLSTYFSPNTHLLGEAVALFFIGVLCPELPQAQRWKQLGWEVALKQAERQVQGDGLHFEQSTYYHVYALDFFLHAGLLASMNGMVVPASFDIALQKMLDVLCVYGRAGTPPTFGDDDGGRLFDPSRNRAEHLLDPLATGAVLFGRGDYKQVAGEIREETLWLVGEAGLAEYDRLPLKAPQPGSVAMQAAGIYVLAGAPGQQMVIDCGHQGAMTAGHGHADALSICMNSAVHPLLIDPGTCEYVGAGPERNMFRGTSFHNTLVVDGESQSQPKGPFTWESLPKVHPQVWTTGENFDLFVGSHDGYRRLPSPVTHQRWVFSLKGQFYLVRDVAQGSGEHTLDLNWHLHPALWQRTNKDSMFFDRTGHAGLRILTPENSGWTRDVRRGWWSPAYGRKESFPVLHFGTVAALPTEFVTLFIPLAAETQQAGELTRMASKASEFSGYRYQAYKSDHRVYFSCDKTWGCDQWKTDAEFLYCGFDASRDVKLLILCRGTYLEIGGKRAISASRSFLRYEIMISGTQVQTFSSDENIVMDEHLLRSFWTESEPALAGSDPKRTRE